jgi:diguanylate cyclase (GGDEF)-like protein/PAS domain S-box-containing protein
MAGENKQTEIQPQYPDDFDGKVGGIAFQSLLEHMLNGVAYCRMLYEACQPTDFVHLYTNPAYEKLTGLKNVTGKLASELIPGIQQSNPELFETYGSVAAGGGPVKFETYIEALGMCFSLSVYSPKQDHFVAMFDVITERKLAEKQLKQSEETYRTMFETVTHGIVYQDNKGRIISANPAAEDILGLSLDQMQGQTSIDPRWGAIHEDGTPFPGETHPTMLAIKTGKPVNDVVMGINNPMVEHTIWIKINAIPIFKKATEEVDYAYSTFEDITERMKSEAELEKNRQQLLQKEEQLRYVLQGSELGFWDWNILTDEVQRNARWAEILGYSYSELKNTTRQWTDFIYPDDREKAWQSIVDVLEGKSPAHKLEYRMLHKDGGIRWVLDQANVIQRSSDGKPTRMSGTHTDITDRKQTEELNKENSLRLNRILDNLFSYVALLDTNGVVQEINKAPLERGGYRREDVIGQLFYEAPWWNYNDEVQTQLIAAIDAANHGELSRYDVIVKMGEDLVPIDFQIAPVYDSSGQIIGLLPTAVDITKRKQAEIQLRISAIAFESQEGMLVTDTDGMILKVNRAFTTITGYSAEDVIGQTPQLFCSDRHDADFYAGILGSIKNTGGWDGEIWSGRKNGEVYPGHLTVTAVKDANNLTSNYVATLTDISIKHAVDEEIKQLAFYDPLTGLSNRRLLMDRLTQHLAHARRSDDLVAVCMIDLDGFKQVNDQLGHEAGDALLIEVAKRLQESVRLSDTVSRFGGDEFCLILTDIKKINECEQSFNRIITSLGTPYQINEHIARVTASIGATIFPNDGDNPDLLLRHADQAMYEAKEAGKNCYCLFNPSHHNQQMSNKAMLEKIGKALGDGQFTLFYQPQVDCRLGQVVGVEALIRWSHPILGILAPSEFIPLLEHDNLIIKVGEWVIQEAIRQQVEWSKAGFDLNVSVNVASRQLHQEIFVSQLIAILNEHHPDTIKNLTIEIVETTALEDISRVSETIKQCRDLGVKFAIDDFGTGFSSLAHLKHLPVNELKIDKSFVFGMLRKPEDLAIVRGVIGLGKSFKHIVVAEGVESIDQILMLMDMGCNIMQGYQIARPMPAEQLTAWLKEFQPHPLWKLPLSQAPSRDYFELLLAETNHSQWIKGQLEIDGDDLQSFNPQQFLDYQQCRFGHWLYGDGNRRFGERNWFLTLQSIHQAIHESAQRLSQLQHDKKLAEASTEAIYLQEQHVLLIDSLKNARRELSEDYLMANLNKSR